MKKKINTDRAIAPPAPPLYTYLRQTVSVHHDSLHITNRAVPAAVAAMLSFLPIT